MTIQSSGMIAALQQTGYFNSTNLASQNKDKEQMGGPNGPKGKDGPGAPPPKGPDLDTDEDGLWSASEIDDFAAAMGLELNSDEIISTYDTNGDGGIDRGERESLAKDNALNLPRPEELMQMRSQALGTQSEETVVQNADDIFGQVMQAYVNSTNYKQDII